MSMGKDRTQRIRPRRSDVRADVLGAAREVFEELGYHRASTDLIARRAGFSKGALYSNFDGKDDLFLALLGHEVAARCDALASGVSAGTDPEAALAVVPAALLDMARDSRANLVFAEFRAHAAGDVDLSLRLAEVRERLVGSVAARISDEVDALGLELTVPAHDAATLLLALVNGLALEQVGHAGPVVSVDSLATKLRGLVRAS
ncbi:helix-turn-helix domain-containing protein [Nocardioides sp.]|uniref:TetR/AcrR family transcriptional regulator n=1 Tax=Nocardioides sp. TaxID=35761 RepID=UPI0031FF1149|nr:TetR/AcrR family transcriptional regulator [Nocardioides sp.]